MSDEDYGTPVILEVRLKMSRGFEKNFIDAMMHEMMTGEMGDAILSGITRGLDGSVKP